MKRRISLYAIVIPILGTLGIGLAFLLMHSNSDGSAPVGTTAEATLVSPDGNETGTATLTQGPNGVLLSP